MIKAVFFDVANTLLEKPALFPQIISAFEKNGYSIDQPELMYRHKFLSETVLFPDKTSQEFYAAFNRELAFSMGIIPTDSLINDIFEACTYLPWKPFQDTDLLNSISLPIGIISNWDHSLGEKLKTHFDKEFEWLLGSQNEGLKKPDPAFYQLILEKTGLNPGEIVYVGDSIKLDIEPALALGIKAILIDRIRFYPESNVNRITHLSELNTFL